MPQLDFEFVSEPIETPPLKLDSEEQKSLVSQMAEAISQVQEGGQQQDEKEPCLKS